MKLILIFVMVVVVQCVFLAAVYAGGLTKNEKSLSGYAKERADKKLKKLTGVSISLVDESGVIWAYTNGFASKEEKKLLTNNTAMRVGSISKVFTAMAVMQLVEQGKLDLDKPYKDYINAFSINSHHPSGPITIRHLLTHRSGLQKDFLKDITKSSETMSYRELPQLLSQSFLIDSPGERFSYSNVGFTLLGILVEKVSKEDFAEYINNHILNPLKMDNSSFLLDARIESEVAKGHGVPSIPAEKGYEYMRDIPAGALNSSNSDMASFMISLLNDGGDVLKPGTLEKMFKRQTTSPIDGFTKMGLGVFVDDFGGKFENVHAISHAGDLAGHHAIMVLIPDQNLGVAIMTNDEDGMDQIHDFAMDLLCKAHDFKTGEKLPSPLTPEVITLTKDQKDKLKGLYVTSYDKDVIWEIFTNKKGKLKIRIGKDNLGLIAYDNDNFEINSHVLTFLGFTGLIDNELKDFRLKLRLVDGKPYFYDDLAGLFLSPITPVPVIDSWKQSIGSYVVDNATEHEMVKPGTRVEVTWHKTHNFLLINGFPVNTINERFAVLMGNSGGLGETIERLPDGSLYASGLIYKK